MRRAAAISEPRGLVMQAISAVDIALWDLKARPLDVALPELFGAVRSDVPVYGSGGFTTLPRRSWPSRSSDGTLPGCPAMKIKIGESWGRRTDRDLARVERLANSHADADLMADANGGYSGPRPAE